MQFQDSNDKLIYIYKKILSIWIISILHSLNNLNFHPREVVSRYHDPQLHAGENYSNLLNLRPHIFKYWCLNSHFIANNTDLIS